MLKKTLATVRKKKKSLIAFNIQELSQLESLAEACEILKKEAICQFSERFFLIFEKFYDLEKIINHYHQRNLFFFLDHCSNIEIIKKCSTYDFDGIMFDGSSLELKKNIKLTNRVFEYLNKKNILLEAEIGPVFGQEDGSNFKFKKLKKEYVSKFVRESEFDLLAIGAGNTHGFVKDLKIDFNLYKLATEINKNINLVFHGASGVNTQILRKAQKMNVVKINYSSSLKKEMVRLNILFFKKNKSFDKISLDNFIKNNLLKFFSDILTKLS
jgi:fructose/tagatose bisphosphate aldolase